jgi:hypothetical protein
LAISHREAGRTGSRMLRHSRTFLSWSVFALVFAALVLIGTLSPSYKRCVERYGSQYDESKKGDVNKTRGRDRIPSFLVCEGYFIDENSGTLSVVATFAIAAFTLTLWRATTRHAAHMEKMVAIQRAFIFLDKFNCELTTAAEAKIPIEKIPQNYKNDSDLYITRFAIQPIWKNSGSTPPINMKINLDWWIPPGIFPAEFGYKKEPRDFFVPPQGTEGSDFIEITGTQVLVDRGMGFLFGTENLIANMGKGRLQGCLRKMPFYLMVLSAPIRSDRDENARALYSVGRPQPLR